MSNTQTTRSDRLPMQFRPLFWAALVLSIPFAFGAIRLACRFVEVPDSAGSLAKGQILESLLFAFGFALGLVGAAVALTSESASRRVLGAATTLFGCAHIMLGFAVNMVVEQHAGSMDTSPWPFMLPALLWAYSVYLAIRAPSRAEDANKESPQAAPQPEPREEQPQLLSQP